MVLKIKATIMVMENTQFNFPKYIKYANDKFEAMTKISIAKAVRYKNL